VACRRRGKLPSRSASHWGSFNRPSGPLAPTAAGRLPRSPWDNGAGANSPEAGTQPRDPTDFDPPPAAPLPSYL